MQSIYADERQDVEAILDELEQYEEKDSVHRVESSFTERGDGLLQAENYNVIITPENIQVKGVEHTNACLLDLEDGEKEAFEYLTSTYSSSNGSSRTA
jgi:hypothetical protein